MSAAAWARSLLPPSSPVPALAHPPPACCSKCPRVGPKTAEKMKVAWEAAHGNLALAAATEAARSATTSPLTTSPGLTMGQLLDSPPSVDFPWGPATRCYSTHLHAAEGVVAQRSLQRAAAYKPPSTRLLNKIRKWLAANQSATGEAWGLLPQGVRERRCLPQLALCA